MTVDSPSSQAPRTRVAYLGPAGTFTEIALQTFIDKGLLGPDPIIIAESTPVTVLDGVREGRYDYGVVPFENSVDGAITPTADALLAPGLRIDAHVDVPITFAAMLRPEQDPQDIHVVTTHPVAYAQLKKWISAHYPQARYQEASSNGAAAQAVAAGEADLAFAPRIAAEHYGLRIIAQDLADYGHAQTRFALIAHSATVPEPPRKPGAEYRSMILVTLKNEPGSLVHALQEFSSRGIDLCRIESRPTREVFGTYHFFLDFLGHYADPEVAAALEAVQEYAQEYSFLGSWSLPDQD